MQLVIGWKTKPRSQTIAIGSEAGRDDQGANGIALGHESGRADQAEFGIAIGEKAGRSIKVLEALELDVVQEKQIKEQRQ